MVRHNIETRPTTAVKPSKDPRNPGHDVEVTFKNVCVRWQDKASARVGRVSRTLIFVTPRSMVTPAPMDRRPDALVQIIPGDLGDDLEAGDRAGDLDPARQEPADRKGIERSQGAPTEGLENRPCVRLCSAKSNHPARLHLVDSTTYHVAGSACPRSMSQATEQAIDMA